MMRRCSQIILADADAANVVTLAAFPSLQNNLGQAPIGPARPAGLALAEAATRRDRVASGDAHCLAYGITATSSVSANLI